MACAKFFSAAHLGLNAALVEVEVDVTCDVEKSSLVIVGLPDTAVRESKDRVLTAIKNSGFSVKDIACTVNLAPGDLRKEGPLYDLPIALALVSAMHKRAFLKSSFPYLIVGELGLDGKTRSIFGALSIAILARELGKTGVLLPVENAAEASAVPEIDIIPITNLKEAVAFLENPSLIAPFKKDYQADVFRFAKAALDFSDIKGQSHVKRAMEIAAAGGHNVLMSGPPGSGKTMIAKATVGIMPELTLEESLEITKVHSIAGFLNQGQGLVTERPFRAPHHTVSYAGLIGGGTYPRPGEVSLAHGGILFLDELPEFSRQVLEVLRQPLEDRRVTISRAQGNFTFPTDFICIAAMNPCPCGHLGQQDKECRDSILQIERYRGKISGPLKDRMDMHIDVPALKYSELTSKEVGESSKVVRDRVSRARKRQHARFGKVKTNGQMLPQEIKQYCELDAACQKHMQRAIEVMGLSARAFDRILRVALTIADLAEEPFGVRHLLEAISFREVTIER